MLKVAIHEEIVLFAQTENKQTNGQVTSELVYRYMYICYPGNSTIASVDSKQHAKENSRGKEMTMNVDIPAIKLN